MKYAPAHIKAIRLLKQLRHQLKAMNTSEAHAVSWIEPRTLTTKRRIAHIGRVISDLEEESTREH